MQLTGRADAWVAGHEILWLSHSPLARSWARREIPEVRLLHTPKEAYSYFPMDEDKHRRVSVE